MNYKQLKIVLFGFTGIMPILVLIITLFLLNNIILAIVFGLLIAFGLTLISHILSSQNPFVKAIQERKVLVFDTPSTGVANVYCADVIKNSSGVGIDIKTETGENRAYDRSITHLLQEPFKALITFGSTKNNAIYNSSETENKITITMTNNEYKRAAWNYDYLTMMFYNSQLGSFVTKPLMSQTEKELLAEYLSLNEARELRLLNKAFVELMRHAFDLIADRFSKFFGNPIVKILIVVVIIIILGYAAMQFLPALTGGTNPVNDSIGGLVKNLS